MSGTRDWDAATYDRVSDPQFSWALPVLDRLELSGDETVLDAGCGSGRVTAELAKRVPRGRVIAVDAAPSMVELAREQLGRRADVFRCDLIELRLAEPVDAVFSTAVFHWIGDHDRLFRRLFDALRPGGQLVAQYGGEGNVRNFLAVAEEVAAGEPFAEHLAGFQGPWNFTSADAAYAALERAGFTEVDAWLEPAPVHPPEPRAFMRTVCLRHHLGRLPDELRDRYVEAIAARLGDSPEFDYVRLNVCARRGD